MHSELFLFISFILLAKYNTGLNGFGIDFAVVYNWMKHKAASYLVALSSRDVKCLIIHKT